MGDGAQPGGTVGQRIAKARLLLGAHAGRIVTQTELGRQVGVAPATVSQWEAGASIPALDTISKIATALGVTPGWIAFGEEMEPQTDLLAPDPRYARKLTDEEIDRARAVRDAEQAARIAAATRPSRKSNGKRG